VNRSNFEHLIAAAAEVTGETEFVVIGSQAILGSNPEAPEALLRSMEADIFPLRAPELADDVDGALGDGSQFHATFGFYAHGVGPATAKPPAGWQDRLVRVNVPARVAAQRTAVVAYCLEPHDLVLAKCAAGRERDWDFAKVALAEDVVNLATLLKRCESLPVAQSKRNTIKQVLESLVHQSDD
jgi:hypothetical protein